MSFLFSLGNPSIWKIFREFEVNRIFTIHNPDKFSAERSEDISIVTLGQRCRISPQFYAEAKINTAFIFAFDFCHVSDSSFSMIVEIKSLNTKQPLITIIRTAAVMDSKTGQSRPLPKHLTERLSSYKTLEKPPPLPVLQLPPSGQYHRWSVRAVPSDMDHMFHVCYN